MVTCVLRDDIEVRLRVKDLGQLVHGDPAFADATQLADNVLHFLGLDRSKCGANMCTLNALLSESMRLEIVTADEIVELARPDSTVRNFMLNHLTSKEPRYPDEVFAEIMRILQIDQGRVTLLVLGWVWKAWHKNKQKAERHNGQAS